MNKFEQGRRLEGTTAQTSELLELSFWPHSVCSFEFRGWVLCLQMRWNSRRKERMLVNKSVVKKKSKELHGHGLCALVAPSAPHPSTPISCLLSCSTHWNVSSFLCPQAHDRCSIISCISKWDQTLERWGLTSTWPRQTQEIIGPRSCLGPPEPQLLYLPQFSKQ